MQQMQEFFSYEIQINSLIKDKIIETNREQAKKLVKFATMLRIPRLHFDYIEKHGVSEFVEFCEDVIKRERAIEANGKYEKEKLSLRNDYTVLKLRKNRLEESQRRRHNQTDVQ